MGCNCNKAVKWYVLMLPGGSQQKFRTEIEARAAKIRNGNVGEIVKK